MGWVIKPIKETIETEESKIIDNKPIELPVEELKSSKKSKKK